MARVVNALLERRATVYAASAVTLLLGLFFIFVWTPLPWGWKGGDGYDTFALVLAAGKPFPTIHVSWGYSYFLAFFYRLFGNNPAIPLTVQAVANAAIPLMLYHLVRAEMSERIAIMAALLTGLFSFNTVYVSTQAPDPLCTVLVVAAMLCLSLGERRENAGYFAAAGILTGISYQFRPNLLLFPPFIAALYLLVRRPWPRVPGGLTWMAAFLAAFVAAAAPWVIRNYRWTGGLFVPATTHGGVQLWFGTLQTGPYQESWLYNPRAAFEFPPVDYTSLDELPIIVSATAQSCGADERKSVDFIYWTNRDRTPRHVPVAPGDRGAFTVEIPPQPSPTAVYYYFDTTAARGPQTFHVATPTAGAENPFTIVVSRDHLGDLDVDGHMLDVYDIVRLLRHLAWNEPLDQAARLDLDGDGRLTEADVRRAAGLLIDERADPAHPPDPAANVSFDQTAATVTFKDGSKLTVPHAWSGKITDLDLVTPVVSSSAAQLMSHSRSFAGLSHTDRPDACLTIGDVTANRVPYRRLPHEMNRFTALALDNIRHNPGSYLLASAWRALRVFIIVGSEDQRTAYQFAGAGRVYAVGQAASTILVLLLVSGVWIARRRRLKLFLLLAPIIYLPLTICFMLINARYSMTMQPFVFAFAAVTLVTALDAATARRQPPPAVRSH